MATLTQWESDKHSVARSADYLLHAGERRDTLPSWLFQTFINGTRKGERDAHHCPQGPVHQ